MYIHTKFGIINTIMIKSRLKFISNFAVFSLLSIASAKGDWCPKDKVIVDNPNIIVKIEGIIDYEDINFCKVIIKQKDIMSQILYTEDGKYYKWIQFEDDKKRTELDIKGKKAVLKMYDKNGDIIEELKSKEAF